MTKDQIDTIIAMYQDDVSYSKIAAHLGLSENTVKHWVRNNRHQYSLSRRRNLADKCGSLSTAVWSDSKWNIKRGLEYITRRWA